MYVFEASFASRNPRSQLPHADHESGQSAGSGSVRHGNHSRFCACFTNFAWPGCLVFSGIYIYIYFLKHVQCQLTGMAITSNPTLKSKAAEFAFPGWLPRQNYTCYLNGWQEANFFAHSLRFFMRQNPILGIAPRQQSMLFAFHSVQARIHT